MHTTGKVIFHDETRFRKRVFRAITVVISIVLSTTLLFAIFDFLGNTKANVQDFNTVRYYNYYYSDVNDKKITLTFDDGPDPRYTAQLLSILETHNVPATFFFLGSEALLRPWFVEDIARRGFEVGNHSFTHSDSIHTSEQRIRWELATTQYILSILTRSSSFFYRPPYLLSIGVDPTINPYIATSQPLEWALQYGYLPVGADIDSADWKAASSEEIVTNILNAAEKGRIVLLHDGGNHDIALMLKALPEAIEILKARGYTFTTLSDVLIPPAPAPLTRDLVFGSQDKDTEGEVSVLQEFLSLEGFLHKDQIKGVFDYATAAGLLEWQISRGLINSNSTPSVFDARLDEQSRLFISRSSVDVYATHKQIREPNFLSEFSRNFVRSTFYSIGVLVPILEVGFILITLFLGVRVVGILSLLIYRSKKERKQKEYSIPWKGKVSVIVPAYNEQENITATIMSIIGGSYPVDDIIVINDGSKDKTAEKVQELQKKYPGVITLITQSNAGKSAALNNGFRHAKHDIVITMDGDSIFSKTAIEHLVAPFTDPKIGAVAGTVLTTNTGSMLDRFQRIEYIGGQYLEKYALDTIGATGVVPGPIGAWRKEVVLATGGYTTDTVVEDQDMTLTVHAAGYGVRYIKEAIAYTETPFTVKDFIKQRFRWVFGTHQCFWKYRRYLGRKMSPQLAFVILPNTMLFNLILPLFFPIIDFAFFFSLLFGLTQAALFGYLLFTFFDVMYVSLALVRSPKHRSLIFFVPIQRLFYRVILSYVIIKSIIKAIEGTYALWNKVMKKGEAQAYFEKQEEVALAASR